MLSLKFLTNLWIGRELTSFIKFQHSWLIKSETGACRSPEWHTLHCCLVSRSNVSCMAIRGAPLPRFSLGDLEMDVGSMNCQQKGRSLRRLDDVPRKHVACGELNNWIMKGSAFCIRPVTTSMSLLQFRWITIRTSEWTYISNWVYSTHFSWPNCMNQIFKIGINISLNVFSSESQTRRWKTWDERGSSLSILCAFLYGLLSRFIGFVVVSKIEHPTVSVRHLVGWRVGAAPLIHGFWSFDVLLTCQNSHPYDLYVDSWSFDTKNRSKLVMLNGETNALGIQQFGKYLFHHCGSSMRGSWITSLCQIDVSKLGTTILSNDLQYHHFPRVMYKPTPL